MHDRMVAALIAGAMLLCGCNKSTEPSTNKGASSTVTQKDQGFAESDESTEASAEPSTSSTTTVERSEALAEAAEQALVSSATPDQVVRAFLEATRSGDD